MRVFINKKSYSWGGCGYVLYVAKNDNFPIAIKEEFELINVDDNLTIYDSNRIVDLVGEEVISSLPAGLHEIKTNEKITKVILRRKALVTISNAFSDTFHNALPFEITKELDKLTLIFNCGDLSINACWGDGYDDGIV